MIKNNGLDTHNINDIEICHAINCRRHSKLTENYGVNSARTLQSKAFDF